MSQPTGFSLVVPWETPPKSRPRVTANGVHTPSSKEEEAVGYLLSSKFRGKPWTEKVGVKATFYRGTARRVDIDNLLKLILDAANGIVYADDSQVCELVSRLHQQAAKPCTELEFYLL